MHRLLVPTEELAMDRPALPKEARDHLKVLRPQAGEEIELFDGRGRWRVFEVRVETEGRGRETRVARRGRGGEGGRETRDEGHEQTRDERRGDEVNFQPRPEELTLFACVTKGSRWDWTIEKATELGATRIVPVISARTIVRIGADDREAKRARWTRIAEDAARQSDAKWVPEVLAPVSFAESLALVKETRCFVGALMAPPPPTIGEAVSHVDAERIRVCGGYAIYVGPEGDFAPEELAALVAIATPVSFGSTILRAETAAIYGLSVLKSRLDRGEASAGTGDTRRET